MLPKGNFRQIIAGLNRLGFKTYSEYLNSSIWVKERANKTNTGKKNKCFICFKPGIAWHHQTYKHLGKEKASHDIVRICHAHHQIAHSVGLNLWAASRAMRKQHKKHVHHQAR